MYSIESIIKSERKKRKISQEKLCEGICSASYLSRIETGDVVPSADLIENLLERLGLHVSKYIKYKTENELQIETLKYNIRRFYAIDDRISHRSELSKLTTLYKKENTLLDQFIRLHSYLLLEDKKSEPLVHIENLNKILSFTKPYINVFELEDELLTQNEIVIINSIAIQLSYCGELQKALSIMRELKLYIEHPRIDLEQKRRTYPLILSNLSKWLSKNGEYAECIVICDKAINYCLQNDSNSIIIDAYFNKGFAFIKLGLIEEGLIIIKTSYYLSVALLKHDYQLIIKEYMEKELNTII